MLKWSWTKAALCRFAYGRPAFAVGIMEGGVSLWNFGGGILAFTLATVHRTVLTDRGRVRLVEVCLVVL